ncbi:DNA gyrase inhibitor YacG [Methylosarcina fibrata]|uniref:DNA gyrase inhibitor YacG n=1 Tax=Methylosarcina fibrata TaxID=105972 RepID=UPI00037EA1A0|nr:DNA gyrase inhibitor YacG [Methylosarcina fibrata]
MPASGKPVIVKCPTCKRPIPWTPEQKYKPFCSERCKLIDLGEWVMEEKRIPGEPQDAEGQDDGNSSLH